MKRLKEIRELKDLSQKEVALDLGISRASYSHYETSKRKPDPEMIKTFSEYFNVSSDYLLEIIDVPLTPAEYKAARNPEILHEYHMDPSKKIILGNEELSQEQIEALIKLIDTFKNK